MNLANLFGKRAGDDGWTQPQREALIDLLILSIYEDRHISLNEQAALERETAQLAWEQPLPPSDYIERRTATIREIRTAPEAREGLIKDINDRLGDYESRQRAFYVCESIMASDGKTPEERTFLDRCKQIMNI